MPRIVKMGKLNVLRWTPREIDRWLNVPLGKNCRIMTNNVLKKDPELNQFFNDETMSALDNYAEHEKLRIYIKPLLSDIFNDASVSVYRNREIETKFPINIPRTKEEIPKFFRELYSEIYKARPRTRSKKIQIVKPTKMDDFKMYVNNVSDRLKNFKLEKIKNFIRNNEAGSGIKRFISNVLEAENDYKL